jgi:hypothetical protein
MRIKDGKNSDPGTVRNYLKDQCRIQIRFKKSFRINSNVVVKVCNPDKCLISLFPIFLAIRRGLNIAADNCIKKGRVGGTGTYVQ